MNQIKGTSNIYKITEIIKEKGKFNKVYKANIIRSGKKVIIKQLNTDFQRSEEDFNRFFLEGRLNLEHENIVNCIDCFKFDENFYNVFEYIESIDLKTFYKNRKLRKKAKFEFYLKIFVELLKTLKFIHEKGVIHRDIRPVNILLCIDSQSGLPNYENPKIKLIDFGLAKITNTNISVKAPFSIIYSPPEYVLNTHDIIDHRADLYSLAVTFYEIITHKIPFYNTHPEAIMNFQLTQPLKAHKKIPDEFIEILNKASAKYAFKKPPNRYNVEELRVLLKEGIEMRYNSAKEILDEIKNHNR